MARAKRGRATKPLDDVFLNIPYDPAFEHLYLAYFAGISGFGLVPHATLEIPGSERRLDRILALLKKCSYSLYDLSRVQLDGHSPSTPRFNMPFELGLAVAWDKVGPKRHHWFVFETMQRRASKSLSDLGGTEVYIHSGSVSGVFRELCNAFVRQGRQPTVPPMWRVYRDLRRNLPSVMGRAGAANPFQARVFRDISVVAKRSAESHVP